MKPLLEDLAVRVERISWRKERQAQRDAIFKKQQLRVLKREFGISLPVRIEQATALLVKLGILRSMLQRRLRNGRPALANAAVCRRLFAIASVHQFYKSNLSAATWRFAVRDAMRGL